MSKEEFIEYSIDLGIIPTEKQMNMLNKYYELLKKENKLYNLTAITEEKEVYLKHFYDSLTITKVINLDSQLICDIGTGAGFPGIILKIFYPKLKMVLLDSTTKKCNFLNKVINELSLIDIKVVNDRAEVYARNNREKYDVVVSRAVAPLKHLLEYGIPLLKVNGVFISMKGNIDKDILNIEPYLNKLKLSSIENINFLLPIEGSNRNLLKIIKFNKTDILYPRNYKEIKKEII